MGVPPLDRANVRMGKSTYICVALHNTFECGLQSLKSVLENWISRCSDSKTRGTPPECVYSRDASTSRRGSCTAPLDTCHSLFKP